MLKFAKKKIRRQKVNEELWDVQQINQIKDDIEAKYAASMTNRRTASKPFSRELKLTDYILVMDIDGRAIL